MYPTTRAGKRGPEPWGFPTSPALTHHHWPHSPLSATPQPPSPTNSLAGLRQGPPAETLAGPKATKPLALSSREKGESSSTCLLGLQAAALPGGNDKSQATFPSVSFVWQLSSSLAPRLSGSPGSAGRTPSSLPGQRLLKPSRDTPLPGPAWDHRQQVRSMRGSCQVVWPTPSGPQPIAAHLKLLGGVNWPRSCQLLACGRRGQGF